MHSSLNHVAKIFLNISYIVLFTCFTVPSSAQNLIFNNLNSETLLPHPSVNSIVQDNNGFIWFATQNGISKYDGKSVKFYSYQPDDPQSIQNTWISKIFLDSEGRLWFGSASGIHLYKPETDGFINFTSEKYLNKNISDIAEDNNGNIWFSTTYSGLLKYDVKSGEFSVIDNSTNGLPTNDINTLKFDKHGNLWVATTNYGLFVKPTNNEYFSTYSDFIQNPLPKENLVSLKFDSNNNLWLGSDSNGVYYVQNNKLAKHYTVDNGLCSNSILDILIDQSGTVWFATDKGLCQLKNNEFIHHEQKQNSSTSLIDNRTKVLMQDQGGVIWVGTDAGVSNWNAAITNFKHFNTSNKKLLKSDTVMAFTSSNNDIFVGSWGEGVSRIPRKDYGDSSYDERLKLINNINIMSMFMDSKNNLWIGTYRSGLYILPFKSSKLINVNENSLTTNQLSSNSVSAFYELPDSTIIVGTYGGRVRCLRDCLQ